VVAHLLRLRLAEIAGAFRSRPLASSLAFLAVAAAAGAMAVGVTMLRDAPRESASTALVVFGSVLAAGFFLAPFVSTRADPLDPVCLAPLPIVPVALAGASTFAGIASVPVLALVAVDTAAAIVGTHLGTPAWVSGLGAALHIVSCVLLARLGFAASDRIRAGGRTREGATLAGIVAIALVVPASVFAASTSWSEGSPWLATWLERVLGLTALGAGAAAVGSGDAFVAPLVAACVWAVALFAAWWGVCAHAFRTLPLVDTHREAGLGWLGILPRGATGAIAARSIIYWASDARYLSNIVVIPVAGLAPVVPLLVAGVDPVIVALIPLPIIAAFLGWIAHNDLAYDSEAVWLHFVSSVRGLADRAGRLVPAAIIAVPLLSATVALTASFAGAWEHLPSLIGVAVALTLSGFGLSSVFSVISPYAVARPGDSPFRQPQRAGGRGVIAPGFVLVATLAIGAPTMLAAYDAIARGADRDREALLTGLGTGAGVLLVGLVLGAVIFEKRGHRLIDVGRAA
jgi:ABC-2 type transport system permease protein